MIIRDINEDYNRWNKPGAPERFATELKVAKGMSPKAIVKKMAALPYDGWGTHIDFDAPELYPYTPRSSFHLWWGAYAYGRRMKDETKRSIGRSNITKVMQDMASRGMSIKSIDFLSTRALITMCLEKDGKSNITDEVIAAVTSKVL